MNSAVRLWIVVWLALMAAWPARSVSQSTTGASGPDTLSAEAVNAFADRVLPSLLDSLQVPGAVFAVVRGASPLHVEGYGWADHARQIPFDSDSTVVRVASVSKLFTATAVLQLYEAGRLRLDADVNTYLPDLQVDSTFATPITLHHLLTHTGGLDERVLNAGDDAPPPALHRVLEKTLPPRVYPPGEIISYSNYGLALAGRVVETVAGQSFVRYQQEHVFEPLGMTLSTFEQPPEDVASLLATGHLLDGDRLTSLPPDYIMLPPAGGLYTTGRDMTRFMAAHLSEASASGLQLLADSTRALMHRTQFRHHPGMLGQAYGFEEHRISGRRALRHDGGWPGWSSTVVVFPEPDVGLFLAANRQVPSLGDAIVKALGDTFLPKVPSPDSQTEQFEPGSVSENVAGTYRFTRHPHTTFEKLVALVGLPVPDAVVTVQGDSALTVRVAGDTLAMRPLASGMFTTGGPDPTRAAIRTDARGEGTFLLFSTAAFERIGWWETLPVQWGLALLCLLGIGSALLFPLLETWVYVHHEGENELPDNMQYARALAVLMAGLHLGFIFVLGIRLYLAGTQGIFHLNPAVIRPMLAIPILAVVFTGGVLGFTVRAWRERVWSQAARIHYTVVAVAATAYVPFLLYWNVLARPF